MANDDVIRARGGLLPVSYPFGAYKKSYYRLTSGTTAADNFYIGQPVDLDSTGQATTVVAITASNTTILGSIVGFLDINREALPSVMETTTAGAYLPGGNAAYVLVADDPGQVFVLQEDTGGSALTLSNIGNSATMTYRSSSGDTTTGYSTIELDRSSAGTGTGGNLLIKGLAENMNSDGTRNAVGNYGKWEVIITNHRLSQTIAQFQGGAPV